MKAKEFINEIERLYPTDFTGGKGFLDIEKSYKPIAKKAVNVKNLRPLPGNNSLMYTTDGNKQQMRIIVLDKDNREPVAMLKLDKSSLPFKNAYAVDIITVDKAHQGQGIAKGLYAAALKDLNITLVAGVSQTPGGRANWVKLAQNPDVEVKGYLTIDDFWFGPANQKEYDKQIQRKKDMGYSDATIQKDMAIKNNEITKRQDAIMNLGAEYLGSFTNKGGHQKIFAIPVTVGPKEVANAIKNSKVKIYTPQGDYDDNWTTGLFAQAV